MGTILQLTMTLESMTMGPQLGVFSMGIFMPWVDAGVSIPIVDEQTFLWFRTSIHL